VAGNAVARNSVAQDRSVAGDHPIGGRPAAQGRPPDQEDQRQGRHRGIRLTHRPDQRVRGHTWRLSGGARCSQRRGRPAAVDPGRPGGLGPVRDRSRPERRGPAGVRQRLRPGSDRSRRHWPRRIMGVASGDCDVAACGPDHPAPASGGPHHEPGARAHNCACPHVCACPHPSAQYDPGPPHHSFRAEAQPQQPAVHDPRSGADHVTHRQPGTHQPCSYQSGTHQPGSNQPGRVTAGGRSPRAGTLARVAGAGRTIVSTS
jgi:hypothetical protein